MKLYTKEMFLKAAEKCEVSMIDMINANILEGEKFIHKDVEYTAHSIEYNEDGSIMSIEDFNHDKVIFFNNK